MDTQAIAEGTHLDLDGELLWNNKTVVQKTGLSRASIYRYIRREAFPPGRRIGPNRVAWVPGEVLAWIESRPRLDHPLSSAKEPRASPAPGNTGRPRVASRA